MKILLATYTHPDFLPPVYEFYSVLAALGHQPIIVCTESYAQESLSTMYNVQAIKNTYKKSFWGRLKYRNALQNAIREYAMSDIELVISFCENSFLMVDKSMQGKKARHFHHSLEVYECRLSDFRRSFLSTWRRYRYVKKLHSCELVASPSYERSGWLTATAGLKTAVHTILNCQTISQDDLDFIAHKVSVKRDAVTIIHTGGVNDTRSVLELVVGFHRAAIPNSELIITNTSESAYCKKIKDYMQTNGIQNIKLYGKVSRDELIQLQKTSDIGVCFMKPKENLGSQMLAPNKIGEYLKYGLHILTVDMTYLDIFNQGFTKVLDINDSEQVGQQLVIAVEKYKSQTADEFRNILSWYNMKHQMRYLISKI